MYEILQTTTIQIQNLEGLMTMVIMGFHILISIILYLKVRRFIVILTNLMFSIIFGLASLSYFYSMQIWILFFDIMLNLLLFVLAMFDVKNYNNRRK